MLVPDIYKMQLNYYVIILLKIFGKHIFMKVIGKWFLCLSLQMVPFALTFRCRWKNYLHLLQTKVTHRMSEFLSVLY